MSEMETYFKEQVEGQIKSLKATIRSRDRKIRSLEKQKEYLLECLKEGHAANRRFVDALEKWVDDHKFEIDCNWDDDGRESYALEKIREKLEGIDGSTAQEVDNG